MVQAPQAHRAYTHEVHVGCTVLCSTEPHVKYCIYILNPIADDSSGHGADASADTGVGGVAQQVQMGVTLRSVSTVLRSTAVAMPCIALLCLLL